MTPEEYCTDKVLVPGSAVYYSRLAVPMAKRPAVAALRAFEAELADTAGIADPGVARLKLRWWRDELRRLFEGNAEHPVTQALRGPVRDHDLPEQEFLDAVAAVDADRQVDHYATFEDVVANARDFVGNVERLVARVLGVRDPDTLAYADELGTARWLTERLRSVPRDAEHGRLYLPHDDLDRHGLTVDDLTTPQAEEALKPLVRDWVDRLDARFAHARALLPKADRRAQRSGLILAAIDRALLREIAQDDYRILTRRIELTPLRRLGIAWRTVWRERLRP